QNINLDPKWDCQLSCYILTLDICVYHKLTQAIEAADIARSRSREYYKKTKAQEGSGISKRATKKQIVLDPLIEGDKVTLQLSLEDYTTVKNIVNSQIKKYNRNKTNKKETNSSDIQYAVK